MPDKENFNCVIQDSVVRRLIPLECCRLQGMPDDWCENLGIEDPTDEQIQFWKEVFETHRLLTDPLKKPKTEKQIKKWLKNPRSDSAEYKMWGNGMALPNVLYVFEGVRQVLLDRYLTQTLEE